MSLKELKRPDESFSEAIIRMGSESHSRTNLIRRICVVISVYSLTVWLYAIAYQLRYPKFVYDVLVWWLPIRMDYLAEAAFALSFICALIIALHPAGKR